MANSPTATTVRLWLIRSTEKAHLFSTTRPGNPSRDSREIWVPRSVIKSLVKFGEEIKPGEWRECEAAIEEWWAQKEGLA